MRTKIAVLVAILLVGILPLSAIHAQGFSEITEISPQNTDTGASKKGSITVGDVLTGIGFLINPAASLKWAVAKFVLPIDEAKDFAGQKIVETITPLVAPAINLPEAGPAMNSALNAMESYSGFLDTPIPGGSNILPAQQDPMPRPSTILWNMFTKSEQKEPESIQTVEDFKPGDFLQSQTDTGSIAPSPGGDVTEDYPTNIQPTARDAGVFSPQTSQTEGLWPFTQGNFPTGENVFELTQTPKVDTSNTSWAYPFNFDSYKLNNDYQVSSVESQTTHVPDTNYYFDWSI